MAVLSREFGPEPDSELFISKTGMCSIEYYASCKDPYRVASNNIPVGWPWLCARASEAANDLGDQLYEPIQKVLSDYNISGGCAKNYNFAPRYTPEDAHYICLIRTRDEFNASWRKAADEIYNDIIEPAATAVGIKMTVEICNEDKMYKDASSLITDDSTINTITRIRPCIVAAVKQHCPGKWTSIAYHAREVQPWSSSQSWIDSSERKPTVIVFVKPGTNHAWAEFEKTIADVIRSATFQGEASISLEILPGRISHPRPSEKANQYHSLNRIPMIPSNGSSISPGLCTDAAGTLGPVVDYHAAGEEDAKKCFLTCYHVVATGDPAEKETNDLHGIGINGRKIDTQINIHYPAKCDSQETKRFHNTRGTQRATDVIKRLDDLAARGPIGHVTFASGNRLLDHHRRMDWALVELDPTLPVQNLLPMEDQFTEECFKDCPDYIVQEGEIVSGINSVIKKNTWHGKVGQTTDCTAGEFNMIPRDIAWPDGSFSEEYELKSIYYNEGFTRGDSGSLVFNIDKEWVGMLFAADGGRGCGFVTPACELLRDIEETTGGKITLV
ncbi:hypothetical protein V494_08146 [Pseudogymnoascus sp. VKM F-4513 (FW-928)]|nr:hypothetical protein V494_08146 [Pseudogymnoascus sp. VKM F-4513 (FW-928)]